MLVSQIIKQKGGRVLTAAPDESLADAARRLDEERVGALIVTEADRIVGVLSERDIVRCVARNGVDALRESVRTGMTADVIYASPNETVDALLTRMTDRRVRHLPVTDSGGRLCGVVSIGDLVKHKISEVEAEAATLKHYIAAG